MKQILVVGCSMILALVVMGTNVVKTSSGLTVTFTITGTPVPRANAATPD